MDKWKNTGGRVPAPGGVSVALALVDITEEEMKRKGRVGAESTRPQKQRRVEVKSPGEGRKDFKVMMKDQLLTTKEDGVDRPNIGIVSKVTGGGQKDRVA